MEDEDFQLYTKILAALVRYELSKVKPCAYCDQPRVGTLSVCLFHSKKE